MKSLSSSTESTFVLTCGECLSFKQECHRHHLCDSTPASVLAGVVVNSCLAILLPASNNISTNSFLVHTAGDPQLGKATLGCTTVNTRAGMFLAGRKVGPVSLLLLFSLQHQWMTKSSSLLLTCLEYSFKITKTLQCFCSKNLSQGYTEGVCRE